MKSITFTGDSVRAILAGTKTQTRRIVKPSPGKQREWLTSDTIGKVPHGEISGGGWQMHSIHADKVHMGVLVPHDDPLGWIKCPYGEVGNQLWVREKHGFEMMYHPMRPPEVKKIGICYAATPLPKCEGRSIVEPPGLDWDCKSWRSHHGAVGLQTMYLSPLRMPQWASRITVEVTGVEVERLQEITNDDARAEGILEYSPQRHAAGISHYRFPGDPRTYRKPGPWHVFASDAYLEAWDTMHKDSPASTNPWVWKLSFKVLEVLT